MLASDVDAVLERAHRQIASDAASNPLINPTFDVDALRNALLGSPEPTWVLERDGEITAHLYAALLQGGGELAAWTGPDGSSSEDNGDLTTLVEFASTHWRDRGARHHFVWCSAQHEHVTRWRDMGYTAFSTRGALVLSRERARGRRDEYVVRRAERRDLPVAYDLDEQLDRAQGDAPERRTPSERRAIRRDLRDTLLDPDNNHLVLEIEGRVVAQCVTFRAPARRGSYPNTVFLSEVAVDQNFRRRGVARHLVDHALSLARDDGFEFCETQWRLSNREAALFWSAYGFTATYQRLQRAL